MIRIVAIVLALSGMFLESTARADEAEVKAVALVENLGGKVTRDDMAPGKPVVKVDLIGKHVTVANLKELVAFSG